MKLSGNSLRQTVHTHRAYVFQTAKLVAAPLKVARVTAGLAESNGRLPSRVYDARHLQADCLEPEPYAPQASTGYTFTFYIYGAAK